MISLPFNALVPLLEPTSKCVRTKSRAVRNGRLMDVMRSRTKAEKRKNTPGTQNIRAILFE